MNFCIPFFHMLQFGLLLAVLLGVFLHAVATAGFFSSLPLRFPPTAVPVVPSCLPQLFSLLPLWLLILVFIPVFRILRLRLLLRFGELPVVFRAAGSPFAVPRLSGCCFPCVSARFLSQGFHQLLRLSLLCSSGCILSLGVCSSSCLFVVFFAPTSVLPPPVCLALFSVALWFSGASDLFGSPVPVAMWSPLGTDQDCYGLCFLGFEMLACDGILSVFVSALFLCLVHIWSSLSDALARWVALGFLWCSVWLDLWFFPAAIPIPTRSSSFRPSSVSSLVSLRSSSLRSLLPFGSTLFCGCPVSSFQFMVLSSFSGHSSSVPSPSLSLATSGSFSFGL